MTEKKVNSRMTHGAYHRVCVYLGSMCDPGKQEINATAGEVAALVAQDVGIAATDAQVRSMCVELGYSMKPDDKRSSAQHIGQIALQVASLAEQVAQLTEKLDALQLEWAPVQDGPEPGPPGS
jgi:hypothetical protein